MEERITSLREWAQKNKIWNKKSWIKFVNDYLEPFYVDLWNIGRFYDFLEELDGKTIGELDNELKEKIRVALYGGVGKVEDRKTFAKYMFDNFGLKVSGSETFEDSAKSYKNQAEISGVDSIRLKIDKNVWKWRDVEKEVENLIRKFIIKIGMTRKQLKMIDMGGNPRNMEWYDIKIEPKKEYKKNPEDLLPNKGEKPEKLNALLDNLKNHSTELAIGKNPYTTFVYAIRTVKADYLKGYLGCSTFELNKLITFLDMKIKDIFENEDLYVIENNTNLRRLVLKIHTDCFNACIGKNILEILENIEKINDRCKETHKKMIKGNVQNMHIKFEPWKGFYQKIFLGCKKYLYDKSYSCGNNIDFWVNSSGKMDKITIHYIYNTGSQWEDEIVPDVNVHKDEVLDVLTKLSFLGLIIVNLTSTNSIDIWWEDNELLRLFVNKVLKNGGRT